MITIAPRRHVARPPGRVLAHVPLVALVVFSVAPLLLLLINSAKTDIEIKISPLGWPSSWQWSNFVDAWTMGGARRVSSTACS